MDAEGLCCSEANASWPGVGESGAPAPTSKARPAGQSQPRDSSAVISVTADLRALWKRRWPHPLGTPSSGLGPPTALPMACALPASLGLTGWLALPTSLHTAQRLIPGFHTWHMVPGSRQLPRP